MSDPDPVLVYSLWLKRTTDGLAVFTRDEVQKYVRRGTFRVGMSLEECREALRVLGWDI